MSASPPGALRFHSSEAAARDRRWAGVAATAPVVSAALPSSHRKERKPFRMVATDQEQLHDSGWNSDMEVQMDTPVPNRPDGVTMKMAGGLNE
jgi:hypothetical protein